MSELHWEARRKQLVSDRKTHLQNKQTKEDKLKNSELYDDVMIREIAIELSADVGAPMATSLRKSHVLLLSKNAAERNNDTSTEVTDVRKIEQGIAYKAKIKNRYNSTSYLQQY